MQKLLPTYCSIFMCVCPYFLKGHFCSKIDFFYSWSRIAQFLNFRFWPQTCPKLICTFACIDQILWWYGRNCIPVLTKLYTSIGKRPTSVYNFINTGIRFRHTDIRFCQCRYNGPNNEELIPIRLLSYIFGLAGLEYLNHKFACFLPLSQL